MLRLWFASCCGRCGRGAGAQIRAPQLNPPLTLPPSSLASPPSPHPPSQQELVQWSFRSKLLITGTPLQNNIRELWALLHFLHPAKFPSADAFEAAHDMRDPAGVARLHAALRPHLLRRVIKDVEKSLPPKNERILRVPMTPLQRQYYRWILTRNFKELNKVSVVAVGLLLLRVRNRRWVAGETRPATGPRCRHFCHFCLAVRLTPPHPHPPRRTGAAR